MNRNGLHGLCVMLSFVFPLGAKAMDPTGLRQRSIAALAQLDGQITVPGLSGPVEVLRDRWGVPHIYASRSEDLFLAQGFVAAQDRLFQMDLWRRQAVGEMAEAFGPKFLDHDRLSRLVRYRGDLDAEWASYSPDAHAIAAAFVRGINAYIDHLAQGPKQRLPIEFQLLGLTPKKWQPEDVLGRLSGLVMTRNFTSELLRAELIAAVGIERARRLAPADPALDFAPEPGLELAGLDHAALAVYERVTGALQFDPREFGSNNWVVDGTLSASGKPLLANDPHRGHQVPALRYLVHLVAPGWNVIGAGEPALPGVAIGHNERVAWGLTIVGTDQTDVVVEETHPDDPSRYRVGDGWQPLTTVVETVAVRNRPAETFTLRFTRHGPVVHEDRARRRLLVLQWSGREPGTAPYLGSLALARAQSAAEFRTAARAWKLPSENLVYADVDGHIGWIAAALTPNRRHSGLLPMPGAAGRAAWDGFLRWKDLPQEFDPPRHYVLTANHNILRPGNRPVSHEWSQPFRHDQLATHFTPGRRFTLDDFARMQHDATTLPGRRLAALARHLRPAEERQAECVRRLLAWDGVLTRETSAGVLYAHWLQELLRTAFAAELGREPTLAMLRFLRGNRGVDVVLAACETADPAWFPGDAKAGRDALLQRTFDRAVERVRAGQGDEVGRWSWGKLHTLTFAHPLATLGPDYAAAFNLGPVPRPGDGYTPDAATHNEQFAQTNGASYRQLFDLADWDRGRATSTPGQSGQLGSPHYDDLLPLWQAGEYFPLKYSRAAVESVTRHRLRLVP